MILDSHHKNDTTRYVQAIRKQKFSVFWSYVETALIKQFIEIDSTTERKKIDRRNKK